MKKRGISHIEVIMAFILFLGALALAFYFFNPIIGKNTQTYSEEVFFNKILSALNANLTTYTLVIYSQEDKVIAVDLGLKIPPSTSVIVQNQSGNFLRSSKDDNYIYFNWAVKDGQIVTIGLSDYFTPTIFDTLSATLDESLYNITSYYTRNLISENKAANLSQDYINGVEYEKTKLKLGLSPENDFIFNLNLPNSQPIQGIKKIPLSVSVVSKNQSAEILRSNGTTVYGNLGVSVW